MPSKIQGEKSPNQFSGKKSESAPGGKLPDPKMFNTKGPRAPSTKND